MRMADLRVSTTDPDASPMHQKRGASRLGYQAHYVVDGGTRRGWSWTCWSRLRR
jgi:hypothetical protein